MQKPQGVYVALVTPWNERGEPSVPRATRLIEFCIAQGVAGIVPVGTTGESPVLDWSHHIHLVRDIGHATYHLATQAGRTVQVIAGTGSNCTAEALHHTEMAAHELIHDCDRKDMGKPHSIDGALLVDPYYNRPCSGQIRTNYYRPIIRAINEVRRGFGVIPYVIPGRTGTQLLPEDLRRLRDEFPENVVAVKDATGNIHNMMHTRLLLGADFSILSGDDNLTATMMVRPDIAASGVISVMANIVPGAIVSMVQAFQTHDIDLGKKIAGELEPLFNAVTITSPSVHQLDGAVHRIEERYPNPCAVKTMLEGLGVNVGLPQAPLGPMAPFAVLVVRNTLRYVWERTPQHLKPLAEFFDIDVDQRLADDTVWKNLSIQAEL